MLKFDGVKIKKVEEKDLADGAFRAVFEIKPLPRGYGHTFGNSVRRALFSSVPGFAITSLRINDIDHEFSTLPGVLENVLDIVLRLQKVRFEVAGSDKKYTIRLSVKGKKEVKAGDFETPSNVKIVNKDLLIATLTDSSAELYIDATIEQGIGFVIADDEKRNDEPGLIPIDAVFSPVRMVNYEVMSTRKGEQANLDKVLMTIETDGSVSPEDSLKIALNTLNNFYSTLVNVVGSIDQNEPTETVELPVEKKEQSTDLSTLNLSAKIENALRNAGIDSIEQLLDMNEADIKSIKGLGKKSVESLIEELAKHNYKLKD